nr:reverse transcriptase domain-containing protein [Tanacetum cinerariifolium]
MYARTRSESSKPRRGRSKSPREKDPERRTVFKRFEKCVFHRLGDKEKNVTAHSRGSERKSYYSSRMDTESYYRSSRSKETEISFEKHRHKREYSRRVKAVSESEGSAGGHWKSKTKKQKSSVEDDLSQPWVCEETDPFTPWIHYFDFPKARMPSHIKTYDGSEDPEDHLKIFQAVAKTKRWAMPTWCHMFNSTLTKNARVWFDDLSKESIDSYDDLRKAFLENYLQQKKCIKDSIEIHNIKQRDGESTEEFVRRITNPELIKRLHDKIPKSMDEMMSVTTTFLRREVSDSNREKKMSFPSWKQEARQKKNFKRGNFRNEQWTKRKQDRFTLLTKTPKEILALNKGKFKPHPPMTTPVEKRIARKLCEYHGEVWHTTNECMHLKRQIDEMLKAEKLSHLIMELKQNHENDQAKTSKKGEPLLKDKLLAILMVQPWQRITRQRITQTFSSESIISFPTLGEEDRMEGLMIIEAEMGGHCVHRIYVDEGSSSEILYEHCFSKFRPKIKNQLIPANTPLITLSSQRDYRKAMDKEYLSNPIHDARNDKIPGGIVTLRSKRIIPLECLMVSEPGVPRSVINQVTKEKIQVAIHPEYPEQTIAICSTLTKEGRKELCGLLRRHLDVFAWKPANMTGVSRHIAEHRLNVYEGCLPVR